MLSGTQPNYLKYKYFNKAQKAAPVTTIPDNDTLSLENDNVGSSWDSTEGLTTAKRSSYTNNHSNDNVEEENERTSRSRTNSEDENTSALDVNESKDLANEEISNASLNSSSLADSDLKNEPLPTKPPHKSKHKSAPKGTSSTNSNNPQTSTPLERIERSNTLSDIPPPSARVLGPSSSTYNIHGGLDDDSVCSDTLEF
jgi:hypothetical protein